MNEVVTKRNWAIYWSWIEGKDYDILAREFSLSVDTIKEICKKLVPDWAKKKPYWSANSYKHFRAWKRLKKIDSENTEKFQHNIHKEG